MFSFSFKVHFYTFVTIIIFAVGISPVVFNLIIDPYEMNEIVEININKEKISEKAHYPLWKISHYDENISDTIILGDSRARALRDKYWHQLGIEGAYNFAYGGATIYEIYDTFHYIKKNPNIKTLVIGIQLRSFDVDHKNGLNRVPEAIRLNENLLNYYSNWFVSKVSYKNVQAKYKDEFDALANLDFSVISSAKAEALSSDKLEHLLNSEICANCVLPQGIAATPYRTVKNDFSYGNGLGVWESLWPQVSISRKLPSKFTKQIRKNATSDWKNFYFSEKLWSYIVEISEWCEQNNVKLVFVIPPTIPEMQERIFEFGFGELNHEFRKRLASLGTVLDFDFDNALTRDLERFTDAYHFDYKVAKMIIGEIAQIILNDEETKELARKRRQHIICPLSNNDPKTEVSDQSLNVVEGKACRIWRVKNDA